MINYIKQFFVLCTLIILISSLFGCTTDVPSSTKLTIPGNPADNPNKEKYVKPKDFPSLPGAITDKNILKLKPKNYSDTNYIYLMIRFSSSISEGKWKIIWDEKTTKEKHIYPRSFEFQFNDQGTFEEKKLQLDGYNVNDNYEPLDGVGYTKEYGFSDESGSRLLTRFYYGYVPLRVKIYGHSDIMFKFTNFVIVDSLVNGEIMGHPAFVRYPEQNPMKIIVPMKDYDPLKYKNLAYITIYFEPEKGSTDNLFPYHAVFDGFEPK